MKRFLWIGAFIAAIAFQAAAAFARDMSHADMKRLQRLSKRMNYYDEGMGKVTYFVSRPAGLALTAGLLASIMAVLFMMRAVQRKADTGGGSSRPNHDSHKEKTEFRHKRVVTHGGRARRLHRMSVRYLD